MGSPRESQSLLSFAVVLGTTVGRDAVIGQLIQETKFKVLLMFDHQSFHIGSRRLH